MHWVGEGSVPWGLPHCPQEPKGVRGPTDGTQKGADAHDGVSFSLAEKGNADHAASRGPSALAREQTLCEPTDRRYQEQPNSPRSQKRGGCLAWGASVSQDEESCDRTDAGAGGTV